MSLEELRKVTIRRLKHSQIIGDTFLVREEQLILKLIDLAKYVSDNNLLNINSEVTK